MTTPNAEEKDEYGFSKSTSFNRKIVYDHIADTSSASSTSSSSMSRSTWGSTVITILFISIMIVYASAVFIAAFHAFNEYKDVPIWLKAVRIYLAVIFAPFYLFYIFVRSVVQGGGSVFDAK
jgi:hypothetical protein